MLYDAKKQQSLKSVACTQGYSGTDVCLHPLSSFVSPYANINFASTNPVFKDA